VALVAGTLDLRGAKGRGRRIAKVTAGLGLAAIGLVLIVVVVTTV
jgi:hypothetical protein